jgi:hypothetical protein
MAEMAWKRIALDFLVWPSLPLLGFPPWLVRAGRVASMRSVDDPTLMFVPFFGELDRKVGRVADDGSYLLVSKG